MSDAEQTLARIDDFLSKEGLGQGEEVSIFVADYPTQGDLRKFKPGCDLAEYRALIEELHRLASGKSWTLNSGEVIEDSAYQEFSSQNGFRSRLAYALTLLGYQGDKVLQEPTRGISPIVVKKSGSPIAALLFVD